MPNLTVQCAFKDIIFVQKMTLDVPAINSTPGNGADRLWGLLNLYRTFGLC